MITDLTLPKTFNNWLGFERGLWQRQSGWFEPVPKRSVFGALSSDGNAGYGDFRLRNKMVGFYVGYDLNIYAPKLPLEPVPMWMNRLNAFDRMTYELHPSVKFDIGLSGFCPIKVTVPGRWPLSSNKSYMSGFEMSLRSFDFESYFDLKSGDVESKKAALKNEGFDLNVWESFKFEICISFKPYNKFEANLSFLSAAILTEGMDGICWDPQTGRRLKGCDALSWAEKEMELQHIATKNQKLVEHPFEGWR